MWEMIIRNTDEGGPSQGPVPAARTNHTICSFNDKLYLYVILLKAGDTPLTMHRFGGTNGSQWFNDVWVFDPRTITWSQLDCIGYIPAPREGHSAALVGDVMYIFGGRTEEGTDLGDLAAFRISTRRWYTFQNMGPSPSPRSGHSMTAYGRQIVVLAGEPSSTSRDPAELSLVYILDTAKIRYPNDQSIQAPAGDRVPGNRRPTNEGPAVTAARPGADSRNESRTGRRPSPEGIRRPMNDSGENMAGPPGHGGQSMGLPPMNGPGMNGLGMNGPNRNQDPAMINGMPQQGPGPGAGPGPRMPRASMAQAPPGPPPQQQAPPPRVNGVIPTYTGQGPRSRTPTRDPRAYGPPVDTQRLDNVDPEHTSPLNREMPGPGPRAPQDRSFSPMGNQRGPPPQQQQPPPSRLVNKIPGADEPPINNGLRSRSQSNTRQETLDEIDDFPTANAGKPIPQYQQQANSQTKQPPAMTAPPSAQTYPDERLRNSPSPVQAQQSKFDELIGQQDDLIRELEMARTKNDWYASELELARKQGFQQSPSRGIDLSDPSAVDLGEKDKPLLEALLAMRSQLSEVQGSMESRIEAAAQQVAEVEQQRDTAIREAVYAKARLAAQGGSHAGTPQSDGASREMGIDDRSSDIGRKLAAALTTQTELRTTIEALKAETLSEKQAREVAEGTAEAAQKRIAEFNQSYNPGEIESLKMELHEVSRVARDESAAKTEIHSQREMLAVEKEDLAKRLEEALDNAEQHSVTFASMREAVTSSTDKTSMLEKKLEDERRHREHLDGKLMQLRAEHEERTAELDSTSKKLRDAEELAETHANEARTHRQVMLAGLEKISNHPPESRSRGISDDRINAMKQQVEQAHVLVRKNQADADEAAEKLRAAEERIAGLEAYQEQSSREGLSARQQLQKTVKDSQALQAKHNALLQQFESHQRDASALSVQHSALRDLIDERNSEKSRQRSFDSQGETSRIQELEQQLQASIAAHAETRSEAETREQEAERSYQAKLDQLDADLQSAVEYVKGIEAYNKKSEKQIAKLRSQNSTLQKQLEETSEQQRGDVLDANAAAEWEAERATLRNEISEMQESVKDSVAQLERQMVEMQGELSTVQRDRDHFRNVHESSQRDFTSASESQRREFEQLQHENAMLEEKCRVVQQRNDRLLQQVTESMNTYKRQSQGGMMMNGIPGGAGAHSRNISTASGGLGMRPAGLDPASSSINPSTTTGGPAEQSRSGDSAIAPPDFLSMSGNSNPNTTAHSDLALEQFQSELDAIRSQWEGSRSQYQQNNRPLSSNFGDFSPDPGNKIYNTGSTPTGPSLPFSSSTTTNTATNHPANNNTNASSANGHQHAREQSFESGTSGTEGSSTTGGMGPTPYVPEGAKGWRQRLEIAEREREEENARRAAAAATTEQEHSIGGGNGNGNGNRGSSPIMGSSGATTGGGGSLKHHHHPNQQPPRRHPSDKNRRSMPGALEPDDLDDEDEMLEDEESEYDDEDEQVLQQQHRQGGGIGGVGGGAGRGGAGGGGSQQGYSTIQNQYPSPTQHQHQSPGQQQYQAPTQQQQQHQSPGQTQNQTQQRI